MGTADAAATPETPAIEVSWHDIFRQDYRALVAFARLVGAGDPEDAVQEAFARTHAARAAPQTSAAGTAYIRRAIVNLVRSQARRRRLMEAWPVHRGRDPLDPEREVIDRATDPAILDALNHLPARRRQAVVLRFWLDLSYESVAAEMRISLGAAKSYVSRGLDDLRSHHRLGSGETDED
jgi:RNA polymerase sigma factor (sigma-70 family)